MFLIKRNQFFDDFASARARDVTNDINVSYNRLCGVHYMYKMMTRRMNANTFSVNGAAQIKTNQNKW